ncbi:MAG TPA: alpha/beta hydrolase [Kofleriaceae bacterium]|nr:alpha/beta hydrolase [Kofleriaceae bacterium]
MSSSRVASADDGEQLSFRIDGAGARAPILTVHGLVSSTQHWRYFTPHFARGREVVSWDYWGHGGQAAAGGREVSVARFADDARAVWQASGARPAIVVGLSFGVQVALELWHRHPEAVRALVLICGTAGHPLDRLTASPGVRGAATRLMRGLGARPRLARGVLGLLDTRVGRRVAREAAYFSGGALRADGPQAVLDDLFVHVAALDPALVGDVIATYLEHTAEPVLPTIRVPTLILAGDRDQLTPVATAERMQRAIAGSELVVFPGHTHLVQVEDPDAVHAAIDGFLARHAL